MQQGYYFVLTEYINGRVSIGLNKFDTEQAAQRSKQRRIKKLAGNADVKRVSVHYQYGMGDVNVKNYV